MTSPPAPADLFDLKAHFLEHLPLDPEPKNFRRQVLHAVASQVAPTPVSDPTLVGWSEAVATMLGFPKDREEAAATLTPLLSGNVVPPGATPWAACYGGHQFGNWAGQLGDGRAISLGEREGAQGGRWELQLKGAGPTPYSRQGDGRAVLRSSIREFLCSEAMHHLGVPTTRALSLVTTGDAVVRDMFYDGRPAPEPGAIVCRVAPSFLRFGNYEIFSSRGDQTTLQALVDYTLKTHFPHLQGPPDQQIAAWFHEVCSRTATLIAHWMRVGFVHGVLNTDNMSILGLTIDYGPYGWLDDYDPNWTPNTTDAHQRRYRYAFQPRIGAWNLGRLAEALHPLVGSLEPFEAGLNQFMTQFTQDYHDMFAQKLGLLTLQDDLDEENPQGRGWLLGELQSLLMSTPTDMTLFFRALARVPLTKSEMSDEALTAPLRLAYYDEAEASALTPKLAAWLRALGQHVSKDGQPEEERRRLMNQANPSVVPRNYLAQLAIEAAEQGDFEPFDRLFEALRDPYKERSDDDPFVGKRPDWAMHKPGCSMLSCSS